MVAGNRVGARVGSPGRVGLSSWDHGTWYLANIDWQTLRGSSEILADP